MSPAEKAILSILSALPPGKSIEPAEAARRLSPDNWHGELHKVRQAGKKLSNDGLIEVLRKGKPVDPHTVKGVIRYRLKVSD